MGTMTARCWDERFESPSPSATSFASEAWSASHPSGTSMFLRTGWPQTSTFIQLPASPTDQHAFKPIDAVFKTDHFEFRLTTREGQSSTRMRDDLDLTIPYPASEFRKYRPESLVCASGRCSGQAVLADLKDVERYNDLPSEHWAELLDAWMCHEDQTLSEELIKKGNNIWPKDGQGLISSSGILLSTKSARGWHMAEDSEVSGLHATS